MKTLISCILLIICIKISNCQENYEEIARYGIKQLKSVTMLDMTESGSKVMYLARHKKYKYSVWINDSLIAANPNPITVLYFQIDSAIVFYMAKDQHTRKWQLFRNNEPISPNYSESMELNRYSVCENSSHLGYVLEYNFKRSVWIDLAQKSEEFEEIEDIYISPIGDRVLYRGKKKGKWAIYINKEKISDDYEKMMCLISQNDFSTWFYTAAENSEYACYLNGTKITAESDYQIPQIVDIAPDFQYELEGVAGIIPQIAENEFRYRKFTRDRNNLAGEPFIVYVSRKDMKWSVWANRDKLSPDFRNHFIVVKGSNQDYSRLAYIVRSKLWINSTLVSPNNLSLAMNTKVVTTPDLDACAYKASRMSTNILLNQRKFALYMNERKITSDYNNIYNWYVNIERADMSYLTDKTLCFNTTCYTLPSNFRIPNKYSTYKAIFDYRLEINETMFPWFFAFSRDTKKVLYSDYPKNPELYRAYPIIFFFIPKQWYTPKVFINGIEAIPQCKTLTYAMDHFIETGELIYASYISKRGGVLHAVSTLEIDPLVTVEKK